MSAEIYWLTLTAVMTALFWVPYVGNRILIGGLYPALANTSRQDCVISPWAERAKMAHANAIENIAIFVPLVLAVVILGVNNTATLLACQVYFWSRLAHFVVYTAGIPVIRTLCFFMGFCAQIVLGTVILVSMD